MSQEHDPHHSERRARGDQTIGDDARTLDDLSLRQRLNPGRKSLQRLLLLAAGYVVLVAASVWLVDAPAHTAGSVSASGWLVPMVVLLAFVFQTMDSAAGMGFGTALAPLLLALGFDPLAVVPVLLIAQTAAGLVSAIIHHEFRNVRFSFKRGHNQATRLTLLLAGVGTIAVVASVVLAYLAIQVPDSAIKTYVALLVLVMGAAALIQRFARRGTPVYRPRRMLWFALIAGFNKGIGGGGYGPVVTLGQINSGVYEKSAAAITSLAESVVSLAGIAAFVAISTVGVELHFGLLPPLLAGSVLGAFVSPYLVRILPNRIFSVLIPIYAFGLGVIILANMYLPLASAG